MSLAPALFAMALESAVPVPPPGIAAELPSERAARLQTWALAVDSVSGGDRAAAAAIYVIHGAESGLSRWVHDGTRKGDCTPGRGCRATCLGSIHPWAPDWESLAGTDLDSTVRCARRTLQAFRSGLFMCASGVTKRELRIALALEFYGRGHCGTPSRESMRRARRWVTVEARLWRST
jgi:hypothetical protein